MVCIHDYSEGYTCRKQEETQSEYFDINKVSLHVSILYRHAVEAVDGVSSSEEEPNTIKEHIFVLLGKFYIYSRKYQNGIPSLQGFIARTRRIYNIELHIARKRDKLDNHFRKWEKLISVFT